MCGIGGFVVQADTYKRQLLDRMLDELLLRLDHRGGDATGFVAINSRGFHFAQKAATKASEFCRHRLGVPEGTLSVLAHTRYATQGRAAWPENNHPVKYRHVYVVHNGWVQNDDELFRVRKALRYGQVDTEAIAMLLAENGWKKVPKSLEQIEGAYAIAALNIHKPGEVVVARGNAMPVHVLVRDKIVVWASTPYAIEQAWKEAFGKSPKKEGMRELKEGEGLIVRAGNIEEFSFTPGERREKTRSSSRSSSHWGGYGDYGYSSAYGAQRAATKAPTPYQPPKHHENLSKGRKIEWYRGTSSDKQGYWVKGLDTNPNIWKFLDYNKAKEEKVGPWADDYNASTQSISQDHPTQSASPAASAKKPDEKPAETKPTLSLVKGGDSPQPETAASCGVIEGITCVEVDEETALKLHDETDWKTVKLELSDASEIDVIISSTGELVALSLPGDLDEELRAEARDEAHKIARIFAGEADRIEEWMNENGFTCDSCDEWKLGKPFYLPHITSDAGLCGACAKEWSEFFEEDRGTTLLLAGSLGMRDGVDFVGL